MCTLFHEVEENTHCMFINCPYTMLIWLRVRGEQTWENRGREKNEIVYIGDTVRIKTRNSYSGFIMAHLARKK